MVAEARVIADLGVKTIASDPVAIRGERLVLSRVRFSGRDLRPDAFRTDVFRLAEIDNDGRVVFFVTSDIDDLDAAIAELDARYLAGEAAPYADRWRACMEVVGELNRHERGPILDGLTYVDHRRIPFAPGDYGHAIEDLWTLVPDARYWIPAVYELDTRHAVLSMVIEGTDTNGNELQWARLVSWDFEQARVDVYEEDDLDAALARFDELSHPAHRLENAASQAYERLRAHFAARDWDAMAELLADDIANEDRRRVVNQGMRWVVTPRVASVRATADLGVTSITATVLATRGTSLALTRDRFSVRDQDSEAFAAGVFDAEVLGIVEIDAQDRITVRIAFDLDDTDAAFEELDARYLAGEAASGAQTWSIVAGVFAGINRGEPPAISPDWVNIDHRRGTLVPPGEMAADIRAAMDQTPGRIYLETVHRLSDLGAVVTHHATSREGFDAEWRAVDLLTVEGGLISRCEVFDESDLDVALARFEELSRPTRRLENTASRAIEKFLTHFTTCDWDTMAGVLAEDVVTEDRRHVVGAGIRRGRDLHIADMRAAAEVGGDRITSTVIATRGEHLALNRIRAYNRNVSSDEFGAEMLGIAELNADNRIAVMVAIDADDIDAAFGELETRYLAGEAALHSETWSLIANAYAALNRRETHPTTLDWVNIDHRRGAPFAPGDGTAYFHVSWDLAPDLHLYIEAVHRLSDLGAVLTRAAKGTSPDGFEAEWRAIDIIAVEGDLISRGEHFDEEALDAALTRFDELSRQTPQLENAASRLYNQFRAAFAARDWDTIAKMIAEDGALIDHRSVVSAGIRCGRDAHVEDLKAIADLGGDNVTWTVIATRGARLLLTRERWSVGQGSEAFFNDVFKIAEFDVDERMFTTVIQFDIDDINAATAELDSRYIAGEAADHARTWTVIANAHAALNRRELPRTTPDWVNIDHQRTTAKAPGELTASIRASWELTPDITHHIEAVHRLTDVGAVTTRCLERDLATGLRRRVAHDRPIHRRRRRYQPLRAIRRVRPQNRAREIRRTQPTGVRPENAASQVLKRHLPLFATRDWGAMADMGGRRLL